MSNPFRDWTPAQVAAYNSRVKLTAVPDRVIPDENYFTELAKAERAIADELAGRKLAVVNNRASTDEQKLNKTERRFLSRLRQLGYPYIGIQNITLKLADDCRFTPDLTVIDQNGNVVFYDVKGFQRDDALVKIKVAARQFAWAKFFLVYWKNNKFEETEIKP